MASEASGAVYRVLKDIFPQVDERVLKAVSIEHANDVDTAVEVVLVEVIPYLTKESTSSSSKSLCIPPQDSDTTGLFTNNPLEDSPCLVNGSSLYEANAENSGVSGGHGDEELGTIEKWEEGAENCTNDNHEEACVNTESIEIISRRNCQGNSVEVAISDESSHVMLTTLKRVETVGAGSLVYNLDANGADMKRAADTDAESPQEHPSTERNLLEMKTSVVQLAPSSDTTDALETSLELVAMPLLTDFEKPESSGSFDAASEKDISSSDMVNLEDESIMNTMVTRSGNVCSIDLLEDIMEDARNNKKILFSGMDSIISLMKEVELRDKSVEQAMDEAGRAGLDILEEVQGLKDMIQRAEETNNMHSGEVYGEKAILATEVRELQSRLLSLSAERDKSLAILDEMRQKLEMRLAEADKQVKAAEEEKLKKEVSARNLLANQKLMMEKVVEESKILRQQAEENSKLREFLMERGSVVDMLQGEINVKCQDAKMLKEKFDKGIPLSRSFSSSRSSSILASSSSSVQSIATDLVPEVAESPKSPIRTSPTRSFDDQHQFPSWEEKARGDVRTLVEDGWEFFDNCEFDM